MSTKEETKEMALYFVSHLSFRNANHALGKEYDATIPDEVIDEVKKMITNKLMERGID